MTTNEPIRHPLEVIADEIRDARKAMRWTQHDLAYASKVPRSTIASAERGVHRLDPITMRKLATVLGVDPYRWERIAAGRPGNLDIGAVDLAALLDGTSPEVRQAVREWVLLPEAMRDQFAPAVQAMIAALRANQTP